VGGGGGGGRGGGGHWGGGTHKFKGGLCREGIRWGTNWILEELLKIKSGGKGARAAGMFNFLKDKKEIYAK